MTVGLNVLDAALDNAILEDSIFSNAGSGIVVDNTAPRPRRCVTSVIDNGSETMITGTITGAPNATYRVEFFSNPAGTGQGQTFLGFVSVTTNGSGSGLLQLLAGLGRRRGPEHHRDGDRSRTAIRRSSPRR